MKWIASLVSSEILIAIVNLCLGRLELVKKTSISYRTNHLYCIKGSVKIYIRMAFSRWEF